MAVPVRCQQLTVSVRVRLRRWMTGSSHTVRTPSVTWPMGRALARSAAPHLHVVQVVHALVLFLGWPEHDGQQDIAVAVNARLPAGEVHGQGVADVGPGHACLAAGCLGHAHLQGLDALLPSRNGCCAQRDRRA